MAGSIALMAFVFSSLLLIGLFGSIYDEKKALKAEKKKHRHRNDADKQRAADEIAKEYQKLLLEEIQK